MTLAKYAVSKHNSKGRLFDEPAPTDRDEFQRDRDRIIHSAAFRRLEYKTQVFVNHEGDLYRTRLTHSIEVAQIARSVARNLRLNEELTEAIALAHDLGHTPFGHAGQEALNQCMKDYGGFEHNLQSLRVVDSLEERYAAFRGLNLCFETREGILKHCSVDNAKKLGTLGERFIYKTQPSLEAQLVDVADALAYNNHDVDDGLRSGLLSLEQLYEYQPFHIHFEKLQKQWPNANTRIIIHETIRRMIHTQVNDLITNAKKAIQDIQNIEEVHSAPNKLIDFSSPVLEEHLLLKKILRQNLYKHPKIKDMTTQAKKIIQDLFSYYMNNPEAIEGISKNVKSDQEVARMCADYIAGMTDRYAEKIWLTIKK